MPANALNNDDHLLAQSCTNIPNLVTNCGFEAAASTNGVVPGWTNVTGYDAFVWNNNPHSGLQSLAFGSGGEDDVLTQTISVKPNTQYLIGAWVYAGGGGTNDFSMTATDVANSNPAVLPTTIYSGSNLSANWVHVGGTVTTSSGKTMTLALRGANPPSHTFVDDVTVIAVPAGCAPIANNLVANCGFEAGSPSPWVEPGTDHASGVYADDAWGGTHALRFASTTADDTWQQVLNTRPKTQYTLSYWVEYWNRDAVPPITNDLHVTVTNVPSQPGGKLKINTAGVTNHFWAHVTKTFTTGSGAGAVLSFAGANKPGWTYVDDVSVTAVPHVRLTAKGRATTTTLTGLGGQKVELEKLVNKSWRVIHTWTAPKTGWSKSWSFTVGSGGTYRSVSTSAPGYSSAASSSIVIK